MSEFENVAIGSIYKAFSIGENSDFEFSNTNEQSIFIIEEFFDKEFLMQDGSVFENIEFLNTSFVKLLKHSVNVKKFKHIHILFLAFCEYYNMDYNTTYLALHEKLQTLIKFYATQFIGKTIIAKYNKKLNTTGIKIKTLNQIANEKSRDTI